MRGVKGISPLVAVIVLIGITLFVAGILAGWVTQIATRQRTQIEYCLDADVIIQGASYDSGTSILYLYVNNRGHVSLNFTAIVTYQNGSLSQYAQGFPVDAGRLETFTLNNVASDMKQVNIQAKECPGALDMLDRRYITGLGL